MNIDKYLTVFKSNWQGSRSWMDLKYRYEGDFPNCLVNSLMPLEFKKFIMKAVFMSEEKYSIKRRDWCHPRICLAFRRSNYIFELLY